MIITHTRGLIANNGLSLVEAYNEELFLDKQGYAAGPEALNPSS